MNLTWHIVKKDFVRLRLPLALWVALMVGQIILSAYLLRVTDDDRLVLQRTLQIADGLHEMLWCLQLFLGLMLVPALVQEDPLVGQQAWWVTRPITGGRLLASKFTALVLFFWVLPVAVALPWWLYCGYGAGELASATAQIIAGQAAMTILAFGFAVLTANYSRFVVVVLVAAFAWICTSFSIFAHYYRGTPAGVAQTRGWVVAGVALVTLGTVIVHQYRTRRLGRSWGILAAGFCLMVLVLRFGPWDWAEAYRMRGGEPPGLGAVTATPVQVEFSERVGGTKDDESLLATHVWVRFDGVPEGYGFARGRFSGSLRWPDGMIAERKGGTDAYLGPDAWRLMGLQVPESWGRFWDLSRTKGALILTTSLPRSLVSKLREEAPVLDTRIEVGVYQGEIVAEVPLKADASDGRKGHWIHLLGVERPKKGGLVLTMAETEPVTEIDNLPGFFITGARRGIPYMFYALCSRDRTKFALIGDERQLYTMMSTVGVMRRSIVFTAGQLANPAEPNWLDDAVLVKVAMHRIGPMVRNAHSDGLIETETSQKRVSVPEIRPKPAPGS